ncbi:oligoendopeptidase F family protein [Aquimarina sp. RZ0]|uniref:oligoendopeptidase F family protein n=1 Tax=Aquimarina sp. RZ0 TaxID=2607730 RepID=UPI0011F1FCDC|nr:oligoendopeptidase F family protein [Aquimarina sp. RZ0]KAA1246824.1 oligoendopeptidase F family protein [Aquimarina sp. RZ0]
MYRLDFSNGIPSIYGVQFASVNDFEEYISVVIHGEYSSAIEIDMSFNDLEIDGKVLGVSFEGKKK